MELGQFLDARKCFQEALALYPGDQHILVGSGLSLIIFLISILNLEEHHCTCIFSIKL